MARVIQHIHCFSGAAGDMLLAAFLDAGLPVDGLRAALGSLGVGCELRVSKHCGPESRRRIHVRDTETGTAHGRAADTHLHDPEQADGHGPSHTHGHGAHRTLKEIAHLIDHSALSAAGKARAKALFTRLGAAEAAIHDMSIYDVHLHEVGAVDSIIDVVGAVYALEWFGIDDIVASPLNVGSGSVQIAHGTFPVPAPATLRLLTGPPIYGADPATELRPLTGARRSSPTTPGPTDQRRPCRSSVWDTALGTRTSRRGPTWCAWLLGSASLRARPSPARRPLPAHRPRRRRQD